MPHTQMNLILSFLYRAIKSVFLGNWSMCKLTVKNTSFRKKIKTESTFIDRSTV